MIVERSREFTVNMGNYESVKIGARVTLDPEEFPELQGATLEASHAKADELLDDMLAADVKEVSELTATRDSFILSWKKS
jgi:hypothetical protein